MQITVTLAQAQLVAQAEQAKAQAVRDAGLVVSAVSAGLVPDGAQLSHVDTSTGVLTFAGPLDAD